MLSLEEKIENLKRSVHDLQYEIDSVRSKHSENSEDEAVVVQGQQLVKNAQLSRNSSRTTVSFDRLGPKAVNIADEPRSTESTVLDEQIFDVTLLVKSCTFKRKTLEKYKLYIALVGEKAQSSWAEIDPTTLKGRPAHNFLKV